MHGLYHVYCTGHRGQPESAFGSPRSDRSSFSAPAAAASSHTHDTTAASPVATTQGDAHTNDAGLARCAAEMNEAPLCACYESLRLCIRIILLATDSTCVIQR